MIKLTSVEKVVLLKFYDLVKGSLNAHIPAQAVQSRFRSDQRGYIPKILKKLRRKGIIQAHPTGGEMTYQLTVQGRNLVKELRSQL